MKIAITSSGTTLDDEVDPRFGRAKYFLVYDTENDALHAVENQQNLNAAQGAGIQAGQLVAATGATALLTGNCGPKAFQVLGQAGIDVCVQVHGKVRQAIEDWKAGKLTAAAGANVEGHWV
jgi:predicted Fe-Mo cluster-binding NifX family protein